MLTKTNSYSTVTGNDRINGATIARISLGKTDGDASYFSMSNML